MGRKNRNAAKRKAIVPIEELVAPTPEQLARGGFVREIVSAEDGGKVSPYVNTGHDPVARWVAAGKLDQRQKAAIDTVRRLWHITGLRQRVTANYGERTAMSVSVELCANTAIDAKADLARIEGYFDGLKPYWDCFTNVCRFGMAAGVAGSELGYGDRGGDIRAHMIVCFIADKIAERERI